MQFDNHVYNNSFERAPFDRGWTKTGAGKAQVINLERGVSPMHLGDNKNGGDLGRETIRSARHSLRLGDSSGRDGISQRLTGLKPKTRYKMSVWSKIEQGQKLTVGVKNYDTDVFGKGDVVEIESEDANDGVWKRYEFEFETGRNTSVTIYLTAKNTSGYVSVDDVMVQECFPA